MIFDILRRKYVALTPEEWVRQHFVHYLIEHKGYPKGLLGNEIELKIGEKRLRCDSILYNKVAQPQMIIEYKAPTIQLQQKTFDQISVYNLLLKVDYLIVSNGLAVVYVQRNACGGCFNRIPPQRQMEIKMRKKIIVCEYCGRIMIDPEAP